MAHPQTDKLLFAKSGPFPQSVAEHIEEIRARCREYGVLRPEMCGSALAQRFDPAAGNPEVLVACPPGHDPGLWMKPRVALHDTLAEMLGRPMDLVMIDAPCKTRFMETIREQRRLLYAA